MPSVWESLQPELQPDHTQQETHRIQAVRLRPLRQGLPEESGPEEAQRDATRTQMKRDQEPAPARITIHSQALSFATHETRNLTKDIFIVWFTRGLLFIYFFLDQESLLSLLNVCILFYTRVKSLYQLGSSLFIYFNKNEGKKTIEINLSGDLLCSTNYGASLGKRVRPWWEFNFTHLQ